ncbi:hypothetical protein [Streptomyces sp. OR43]|uniref:hypothetical protein n=1 Tax=Streptomyces sp. or43 TaxID=2478957 RepID=UPI0011CDD563|nr:hypothetical protein [Streptomyces sp. or43]TXS34965.1 hypothetical protein EAO72_40295 [Streptomyces sp. or43]
MVTREYQGAGGLRLHLDEPLSDEMRKQIARGHLVPVDDAPEAEPVKKAPAKAETAVEEAPKRPGANAKAETWQAYAIALGMDPEQAKDATKADCQDYAQVVEEARAAEQSGDTTETTE